MFNKIRKDSHFVKSFKGLDFLEGETIEKADLCDLMQHPFLFLVFKTGRVFKVSVLGKNNTWIEIIKNRLITKFHIWEDKSKFPPLWDNFVINKQNSSYCKIITCKEIITNNGINTSNKGWCILIKNDHCYWLKTIQSKIISTFSKKRLVLSIDKSECVFKSIDLPLLKNKVIEEAYLVKNSIEGSAVYLQVLDDSKVRFLVEIMIDEKYKNQG